MCCAAVLSGLERTGECRRSRGRLEREREKGHEMTGGIAKNDSEAEKERRREGEEDNLPLVMCLSSHESAVLVDERMSRNFLVP